MPHAPKSGSGKRAVDPPRLFSPLAPSESSSPESKVELSVVMPCLNEAATLARCIDEARAGMARASIAGEIIVADNGSDDGSPQIAAGLGARVVAVQEKGYGHALRGGIAAARGRFVAMGDADASYDFGHLERFVVKLRDGCDFVIGNRFAGGIAPGAMPWKNRHIGNPLLSFVGRLFFGGAVRDFHCGLRAFNAGAIRRLELRTTGMEFASEMVIKAQLHGLRIAEVPTVLRRDGRSRRPHLRPWRDGWRHLRFMLLFSPRWLFLLPGIVLMLGGGILGGRLLIGPLRIFDRATLDVHTLLFCAAGVVVGFQSITFAVMAKEFALRQGLRQRDERFAHWMRHLTLESGVIVGAVLALVGGGLSIGAVWYWGHRNFGNLDPNQVLRWVIPGATCITLGCQIVLVSFFLGVFQLGVQKPLPDAD
jgi:glycosyltransferase involved in cell wall biosynthesis